MIEEVPLFDANITALPSWRRTLARVTHPGLAKAVKEDAIERADAHADPDWKDLAYSAVRTCACENYDFTADDVWELLWRSHSPQATTHEPSALGPVFLRASRDGMIQKTGHVRASRHPRRHRDLTVWRLA